MFKIKNRFILNIKKLFVSILVLVLAFLTLPLMGDETETNLFETPNCLKDNVAFWKKIYTEVSLKEGLLHDNEYPLVIYQKIYVGTLSGRTRRRLVGKYIDDIKHSLKIINEKPQALWGAKEKEIFSLFVEHGDITYLKGAADRIRFQLGQKERFKEGLEHSAAYMDYIRQVFKQYGIPERIAYLPHVESSFNVRAYSKVGAAGIWQFMRRTARLFMNVSSHVDERKDPFKSTVAAAKLLKLNYQELKSWPLAITAYNHGTESMKRASSIFKTTDLGVIIENYRDRRFRFASKNFYSCFLAASEIAANPGQYFTDLIYHTPIQYNEIVLLSQFKPAALAGRLGISQDELARWNPALLPSIFRHQGNIPRGYRLRLPPSLTPEMAAVKIASVQSIPNILDKTPSAANTDTTETQNTKDYQYYTVSEGDTLYDIAQNFGISVDAILAVNDIERENRLSIGQVLRIPVKK